METIDYNTIPEFEKDFKKLSKSYKTLETDFDNMKKNLLEVHYLKGVTFPPKVLVDIEGCCSDCYTSKKVRKFACASLKGEGSYSGIRVIYVYEKIKRHKITFIEMYYKGKKANEDRERLKEFIKTLN